MIRSSNPATPPAIRLNLLAEREDVDALARAIERTREIIATEPLASAVEREILPGTGTELETYIRDTAITTFHASCSVAMGSDPDNALDESFGFAVSKTSASPMRPRYRAYRVPIRTRRRS